MGLSLGAGSMPAKQCGAIVAVLMAIFAGNQSRGGDAGEYRC